MKRNVVSAALAGIALSVILGIVYYFTTVDYQHASEAPPYTTLILEAFKTLLTFSLVTTGGVVLKALIDHVIDKDKNREVKMSRREDTRKLILKEFTTIYSEFYSIRKLYRSALTHSKVYEKDSDDFKMLVRELLQKSVDLEGRYGALKVTIIIHFNLRRGGYQSQSISHLEKELLIVTDKKEAARIGLDLLGEYYDEWRHALEKVEGIGLPNNFWENYNLLLNFLGHEQ